MPYQPHTLLYMFVFLDSCYLVSVTFSFSNNYCWCCIVLLPSLILQRSLFYFISFIFPCTVVDWPMAGGPLKILQKGPFLLKRSPFCTNLFESFRVSKQYAPFPLGPPCPMKSSEPVRHCPCTSMYMVLQWICNTIQHEQ